MMIINHRCYWFGGLVASCFILSYIFLFCDKYYHHSFDATDVQVTNDHHNELHHRHLIESTTVSDPDTAGVSNPFMSSLCADFIDDPQLLVTVKFFSIVMVVRNEEKSGVLASVSVFLHI
jgi:hypothetical protein